LLPGVPDADDACVARLKSEIAGREGIEDVHVKTTGHDGPTQLCIHYDPEVTPLVRLRELVESAGARISERFGHVMWQVDGIIHQRRARTLSDRLRMLPGVLEAQASASGRIRVEFDRTLGSEQAVRDALADMGINVIEPVAARDPGPQSDHSTKGRVADAHAHHEHEGHSHAEEQHNHAHGGLLGPNTELILALACGAVLGIGVAI